MTIVFLMIAASVVTVVTEIGFVKGTPKILTHPSCFGKGTFHDVKLGFTPLDDVNIRIYNVRIYKMRCCPVR